MLFITEFQYLPRDGKPPFHPMQLADLAAVLRSQAVDISGTSAASDPMVGSRYVRVLATEPCHIKTGAAPTATTGDLYLAAGIPEYFAVKAGQSLAVIEAA